MHGGKLKLKLWAYVCACLCYRASKAHISCAVLYCHLWPVWLYHIFSTLSHKRQFSEEKYRCPTGYRTWLACGPLLRVATIRRATDTFLFISHTTKVLLFKFRCNIFIGVRIIKEMPGSVASGTHCIWNVNVFCFFPKSLSGAFLIPRRIQQHIFVNVLRSSCRVPVIHVRF